jgi:hypothetical protein
MAKLVSDIGIEHRKHTANARKAVVYRQMAAAIVAQDDAAITALPKSVPRGHPPDWYLSRAETAEQASTAARDMANLLSDMETRNRLEAMTAEQVWESLVGGQRWVGDHGMLATIGSFVDMLGERLPYLWQKLDTDQRQLCQQFIRRKMEDLIAAFDGRGPWTR